MDCIIYTGVALKPDSFDDHFPLVSEAGQISGRNGDTYEVNPWQVIPVVTYYTVTSRNFDYQRYLQGVQEPPTFKPKIKGSYSIIGINLTDHLVIVLTYYQEEAYQQILPLLNKISNYDISSSQLTLKSKGSENDFLKIQDQLEKLGRKHVIASRKSGLTTTTNENPLGLSWGEINFSGRWQRQVVGPNGAMWGEIG